ncbi:MAG: PocR ligand-binding domain-containing protein [Verrucomicrobiae bacterium]|nr:PocR ligand-binding domain-containing protein [Verrucomicrobiae bacterium]
MKAAAYEALARSKIVREYETAFRKATGLTLRLAPEGVPDRRPAATGQENPLCALIARQPRGCEACLKTQAQALRKLGHKLAPQQVRCFAGLTDVAVPVIIGGQHVATLLAGQVFRKKPTRRDFARLSRQLAEWGSKTARRRLEAAYFHTRVLKDEQFRAIVQLLTLFAHHLAEFANRCLLASHYEEPAPVVRAKDFVKERASGHLSMRDAAQHVHLSAYYFCKMFKKTTGMTFTEYVSRVRIEKAKNLLLNPHARVSEVAFASGFQSIPHFNRVFRKYAGMAPRAYGASARAQLGAAKRDAG